VADAAQVAAQPSISVFLEATTDATERFTSPDAFIAGVSPEALNRFQRIECVVREREIEITWRLSRPTGAVLRGGRARGLLEVTGTSLEHESAAAMIRAVNRGYRPYWGPCSWPPEVLAQTFYQRHGAGLRSAFNAALGGMLGLALALTAKRIAGADPPDIGIAVAVLLTGLLPFVVDWAVPDIEVALLGRTRLVVVVRRLAGAAGGALSAQILAFLFGKA
jgi:hypothetical protein